MCSTLETECSQAFCTVGFHSHGVFDSVQIKLLIVGRTRTLPKAELSFQAGEGRWQWQHRELWAGSAHSSVFH